MQTKKFDKYHRVIWLDTHLVTYKEPYKATRQDIVQSIKSSIKKQLDANKSRNLLFENAPQIMSVEPGFLAALEEVLNSDTHEDFPARFVTFATEELLKRLHTVNPYLHIKKSQVEDLEQIYRHTWQRMMETRDIKTTLNEFHYPQLAKWLTALYPEEFRESLRSVTKVNPVTYQEYSADLQIEVLGIDLTHIKEPAIDIGCGSQANLTRHLRSLGIEAYGIDRNLETREPYLAQEDWFDYYFEPNKWGAIVSNMGFTNHLNYAYLHDASQLEHYLLKMKEIIESLSPGGCFYYAPSLPFIEGKLSPEDYAMERKQRFNSISVSRVIKTEQSQ